MDQCCPRGNRPAHSTVAKASSTRNPRDDHIKEPQPQASAPTPRSSSLVRSSATSNQKARKETKKLWHLDQQLKDSNSSPARSSETSDKKSRRENKEQRRQDIKQGRNSETPATGGVRKNLNHSNCFNCGEEYHYATKCSEPRKDAASNN